MKKFLPLLVLLLFGCQSVTKIEHKIPEPVVKVPVISESTTHDQFESQNLQTSKIEEKKTPVALFLPFSGKNKDLGWSLFNAFARRARGRPDIVIGRVRQHCRATFEIHSSWSGSVRCLRCLCLQCLCLCLRIPCSL